MTIISFIIICGLAWVVWQNYQILQNQNLMALSNKEALEKFLAEQRAFNLAQSKSIDGIAGDIKKLNDKITELTDQLEVGEEVTAANITALDEVRAESQAIAKKAADLDAQDEAGPDVPPTPTVV